MTRTSITAFIAALSLASITARAAPLDAETCTKLKTEQTQLEQAGVRASMANGAEWAKTNLQADKLQQVKRLVEVDEQLLFRCHGAPLVNLNVEPEDGQPGADDTKAGHKKAVPKPPADQKKAAATKKPEPVEASAGGQIKPAVKKAAPVAKTQPKEVKAPVSQPPATKPAKAKPKVDDAYRPPPAETGSNPFAGQLPPRQ